MQVSKSCLYGKQTYQSAQRLGINISYSELFQVTNSLKEVRQS